MIHLQMHRALLALLFVLAASISGAAQELSSIKGLPRCSHVIVPQSRSFSLDTRAGGGVQIESVEARIKIHSRTASTSLEVNLVNRGARQAEAIILLPVPEDAVVTSFLFDGASAEPTAQVLPRAQARTIYDSIVARIKDPALLEFAGYRLIRTSVFPVPSNGKQKVRLTYEHLLAADGDRIDYVLPRSESLDVHVPWKISVQIQAKQPISMVYSPSHHLITQRTDARRMSMTVDSKNAASPGPFLFSYLRETNGVTASLFAYPDPQVGGGYFLLMAGLPAELRASQKGRKREVTIVMDRSGSMAGPKMTQALAAASQIIEGLSPGEAFNIVDYATSVSSFSPAPVVKTKETIQKARTYLARLRPTGGTNIYDALSDALRPEPIGDMLPIVLFLTDGLPTVGKTSEVDIHDLIRIANPYRRRVFAFGVGSDVNVPLLDRIADSTRASTTYVLPQENVEIKVGSVFKRLYGPVLSDIELTVLDKDGSVTTRRAQELTPEQVPDLFEGDELILLGQYREQDPLSFKLTGNFLGQRKSFLFRFNLNSATTRNAFVPRLWAGRRIAYLVDQIRQMGASLPDRPLEIGYRGPTDPRFQELVVEIVRLSTEFGILSEYTSFLATEGTNLSDWANIVSSCGTVLNNRAVQCRSGIEAVNQGINFNEQKLLTTRNYTNSFMNDKLDREEISGVQQICDRTFFKRGNQWIDARLIAGKRELSADETIQFGSTAHLSLLDELIQSGRQGVLSLQGEILLEYRGKKILIR